MVCMLRPIMGQSRLLQDNSIDAVEGRRRKTHRQLMCRDVYTLQWWRAECGGARRVTHGRAERTEGR